MTDHHRCPILISVVDTLGLRELYLGNPEAAPYIVEAVEAAKTAGAWPILALVCEAYQPDDIGRDLVRLSRGEAPKAFEALSTDDRSALAEAAEVIRLHLHQLTEC